LKSDITVKNLILPCSEKYIVPSKGAIIAGFLGILISKSCLILSIPVARSASLPEATQPPWNVFNVNCVAGSPIL
jgi:hypothetical protein